MNHDRGGPAYGFHAGELAVQRDAGVTREALRLEGMLAPAELGLGVAAFLGDQTFAAITGRSRDGRLWTAPLLGQPGFLAVRDAKTLEVRAFPGPTDPLRDLQPGQDVGLIAVDYSRRRRLRLNGTLSAVGPQALTITADEAYGNCPQYIPQRTLTLLPDDGTDNPVGARSAADRATVARADTFFLGTTHPERGNDASHRGGPPGFVRADGDTLWWPDYAGNNMFNSLGNLHADSEAALLFLDFTDRTALHLNGTAALVTVPVGSPGDDGGTGRRIVFTVRKQARTPLAAGSDLLTAYPRNPPVTD